MPLILDGRVVRTQKERSLRSIVETLDRKPCLGIIQVGSLAPSNAYIAQKKMCAEAVGFDVDHVQLPGTISEYDLLKKIEEFNTDPDVDGVLVQLPLPSHIRPQAAIDAINPIKDVDGLTKVNSGKLYANDPSGLVPATARGVMSLLEHYNIPVAGKHALVIGRSQIVGRPIALALMHRNATVTIAHRHTKNLIELAQQADIIIAGAGQPGLITDEFVHEKSVVVDVGITPIELPEKKLVGDVDFALVSPKVAAISPVPGGVGPMTVISLIENVLQAYQSRDQFLD
jgi:methylenetetrahydrofolate dehydrogenase (NADP+) / methenyltetrahydrofolate cyclohydrolase